MRFLVQDFSTKTSKFKLLQKNGYRLNFVIIISVQKAEKESNVSIK